jgi:tripartite ATP-independent transporter DctM subunit
MPAVEAHAALPARPPARWWHRAEDGLIVAALAAMTVLPALEVVTRTFGVAGVAASSTIVQHLTLVVGMIGGALAARDGRLLALSAAANLLPERWRTRVHWLCRAISATVAGLLGLASVEFVQAEREAGGAALAGVPIWVIQAALPVGFAVVFLRLLHQAGPGWAARVGAGLGAAALAAAAAWAPLSPPLLVWTTIGILLLATAFGAPIFVMLGGAGLVLFWGADEPVAAMSVEHYRLVVNPALPSLPLFTLAGYLLAEGGASRRLVRLFQALVGWFRGGPAIATVLLCAFFTALTGGSGVTILALSGLLLPVLLAAHYTEREALGLLTGASSLGILLPPCLPVILYAIIANVGIREMFIAGLLPAALRIALTAGWGVWQGRRSVVALPPFNLREARHAVWEAKWELLLPVVALGALFGGWATPVEAAALTALYAFLVEVVIHREMHLFRDCPRVLVESGLLIGGILLILGVALGLTNYLISAQVPDLLAAWGAEHVQSRWLFLLGLNLVLLVVGSLIEIYAAIVVIVPLLVPIGLQLGLHPIHLGIIFLANLELGFLMPPMGLNLLLASSRLKKPMSETTRAVVPLFLLLLFSLLLITYWPALSTALLP